jgi:hypothetical protein
VPELAVAALDTTTWPAFAELAQAHRGSRRDLLERGPDLGNDRAAAGQVPLSPSQERRSPP